MSNAAQIKDVLFIEAKLDGEDITGMDLFEEILIIENIASTLPTASITFNDSKKVTIKELQLTDGIKLELTVAKSENDNKKPANFVMFSDSGSRTFSSGHRSTTHFILEAPKYLAATPKMAKKCSSSDMIKEIASKCGLTFDGESTKDEQIWYVVGQTYCGAARHIVNHGYMSDTSCMVHLVTADKKLLYKDINKIAKGDEPKKKLYTSTSVSDDDPSVILIQADKARTNSGLMNNWINYGYIYHSHGIKEEPKDFDKVEAQKREAKLAMSESLKGEVEIARLDLSYFDIGNIHEKYHRAYYQNLRYRAMFTETISIIIHEFSELELLDVVEVIIGESVDKDVSNMIETVKSGCYVLTGKVKVIRNGRLYGERLELMRNSTRSVGSNELVG